MRTRLLQLWISLRSSYWFIPSGMAIGAVALTAVMLLWDARRPLDGANGAFWLYVPTPEGARELLATIAGSMITVAGVTFAITIGALVQAAYQFSPRLLTNFMRDRANQATLGTFVATFLYCLLVMRGVQSPAEGPGAFTPHRAVFVALFLAIASVAVLIYYLHHIPQSIHISNVLAQIGGELERMLHDLYPDRIGHDDSPLSPPDDDAGLTRGFLETAVPVYASSSGYIQAIDPNDLLTTATREDIVVRLIVRPGDFVGSGHRIAEVGPPRRADQDVLNRVRAAFAIGRQRTPDQDLMFLVDELVEISSRALSPGQNDPFTAMACLDWLGNALVARMLRKTPSAHRFDKDGQLRVVADPPTVEELVEGVFDGLRPYLSTDRNAGIHAAHMLVRTAELVEGRHHDCLVTQAEALQQGACRNNWHPRDLAELGAALHPLTAPECPGLRA